MALAAHTNTNFAHGESVPLILGHFVEADYGHGFEYAVRPDEGLNFAPDFPHIIYTGEETRYARVLKTVAYIVIDEAADGSPVYERWAIKRHRHYDTEWAFRQRRARAEALARFDQLQEA